MTSTPAATSEMVDLDQLGAKAFDGFLVRKDLVRKYSRQYPAPTYVVEFLMGRHCASTDPAEIEAGLQIVKKQRPARLPQRYLHGLGAPGVRPGTRDFLIRSIESRSSTTPCRLNAIAIAELAVEKPAKELLMPVSARRGLNDVPGSGSTRTKDHILRTIKKSDGVTLDFDHIVKRNSCSLIGQGREFFGVASRQPIYKVC
jgi:hypothetical protein